MMIAIVIAIAMMKTTATTPPMMAAVLSELDTLVLSFTDAGATN